MRKTAIVFVVIMLFCGCDPKGKYNFSTLKETDEMMQEKKHARFWTGISSEAKNAQVSAEVKTD